MCDASSVSSGRGGIVPCERRQPVAIPRNDVDDDLHIVRVHVGEHLLRIALEHLAD